MTNDKIRQDFEAAYSSGDTICDAMSLARREDGEYEQALARLCCRWFMKGRAAERAGIRDKLESEGVVGVVAKELYTNATAPNPRTIPFEQSSEERLRYMFQAKSAIAKILEVI